MIEIERAFLQAIPSKGCVCVLCGQCQRGRVRCDPQAMPLARRLNPETCEWAWAWLICHLQESRFSTTPHTSKSPPVIKPKGQGGVLVVVALSSSYLAHKCQAPSSPRAQTPSGPRHPTTQEARDAASRPTAPQAAPSPQAPIPSRSTLSTAAFSRCEGCVAGGERGTQPVVFRRGRRRCCCPRVSCYDSACRALC